MLKNATMDGGPMTYHLVKVRVLTDLTNKLEKKLLIIMGIGRGDDLRLHEVNVACLFWTFFTIFTERKGGKYRIHISNKDASEVFTMFGTDLTL